MRLLEASESSLGLQRPGDTHERHRVLNRIVLCVLVSVTLCVTAVQLTALHAAGAERTSFRLSPMK